MWGISGPASEYLFDHGVDVTWLITSKMLIAGIILGIYCAIKDWRGFLAPWRSTKAVVHMAVFVLLGMVAMQYVYFKAIAVATAATATVLQYLSPILVTLWVALSTRTMPRRSDGLTILLAFFGTLLVVTKGAITSLAITPAALFWGIMAAVAAASYTLLPRWLTATYSGTVVSAWAMILGGAGMTVVSPVWRNIPAMTPLMWGNYTFIVLFGTVLAYAFYLLSLNYVAPTAVSLLEAFEPLGAVLTGVLFLHLHLSLWEVVGGVLILIAVAMMMLLTPKTPPVGEGSRT